MANQIRFLPENSFFQTQVLALDRESLLAFAAQFLKVSDYNQFRSTYQNNSITALDSLYNQIKNDGVVYAKFKKACIKKALYKLIYPQILIFVAKDHEKSAVDKVSKYLLLYMNAIRFLRMKVLISYKWIAQVELWLARLKIYPVA
jgi:hypothetical protein